MPEMNSLTLNGTTYDCFVDDVARSSVVVCSASGENIVVSDSSTNPLVGLNIYGKSTQAGTPTPDAPVDIVSVGEGGSIEARVYGKSIVGCYDKQTITTYGITFTINGDGSVTANGTATGDANLNVGEYNNWYLPKGKYKFSTGIKSNALVLIVGLKDNENVPYVYGQNEIEFVCNNSGKKNGHCVIQIQSGRTVSNLTFYPMIRVASASSSFEKVKTPQSISISTPDGLNALPVTDQTIATYTDANGKMWCADEIDLARGVRVQRLGKWVIDGSITPTTFVDGNSGGSVVGYLYSDVMKGISTNRVPKMCNRLQPPAMTHPESYKDCKIGYWYFNSGGATTPDIFLVFNVGDFETAEDVADYLKVNPLTFIGILAVPIETPLTDEEIAAYKTIHTNKPSTTVLNDGGAYMSMNYIADAKSYIDNKVSGILSATVE